MNTFSGIPGLSVFINNRTGNVFFKRVVTGSVTNSTDVEEYSNFDTLGIEKNVMKRLLKRL